MKVFYLFSTVHILMPKIFRETLAGIWSVPGVRLGTELNCFREIVPLHVGGQFCPFSALILLVVMCSL